MQGCLDSLGLAEYDSMASINRLQIGTVQSDPRQSN